MILDKVSSRDACGGWLHFGPKQNSLNLNNINASCQNYSEFTNNIKDDYYSFGFGKLSIAKLMHMREYFVLEKPIKLEFILNKNEKYLDN